MIKKCKTCNVEKDINLFSRIKSIKNEWMYKNECKKCANIRNMKNYYIRTLHKVKAKEQRLNELTNIQLIESKKHFPPIQLVFNFYSNQTEIWKDIKGYEGSYKISNWGRVKSLARKGGFSFLKEKICKLQMLSGYYFANLFKNCYGKKKGVHNLVANAFIENLYNKPIVNHINGIKKDNRVENLEWSNNSENMKHAYKMGLSKPQRGMNHGRRKINEMTVLEIRKKYYSNQLNQHQLAKIYNLNQSHISDIVNRMTWKHI